MADRRSDINRAFPAILGTAVKRTRTRCRGVQRGRVSTCTGRASGPRSRARAPMSGESCAARDGLPVVAAAGRRDDATARRRVARGDRKALHVVGGRGVTLDSKHATTPPTDPRRSVTSIVPPGAWSDRRGRDPHRGRVPRSACAAVPEVWVGDPVRPATCWDACCPIGGEQILEAGAGVVMTVRVPGQHAKSCWSASPSPLVAAPRSGTLDADSYSWATIWRTFDELMAKMGGKLGRKSPKKQPAVRGTWEPPKPKSVRSWSPSPAHPCCPGGP